MTREKICINLPEKMEDDLGCRQLRVFFFGEIRIIFVLRSSGELRGWRSRKRCNARDKRGKGCKNRCRVSIGIIEYGWFSDSEILLEHEALITDDAVFVNRHASLSHRLNFQVNPIESQFLLPTFGFIHFLDIPYILLQIPSLKDVSDLIFSPVVKSKFF